MSAKYKLSYFDITALAEPIRFMFAYGGIEYEDVRVSKEQWPAIKPTMPFGQMPILEVNGKVYNQSLAIGRYVSKLVKLYGSSIEEELQIDSMVDNINDVRMKIGQYAYEQDEVQKEKKRGPLVNETLPYLCGKLDEIVKQNNGYFVNGKVSYADMFFVALLDYMNYMLKFDLIEKYPNLQKVKENVTSLPAIKEWIEKRPKNGP